jgi:hypothetical protein
MAMPTREVGSVGLLLRGRVGRASNEPQGHHSTAKNNKLHEPQARDIQPHSDSFIRYIGFPLSSSETYHHGS